MNDQNLIPIRSASEARERGRAGGKKSGESRRRKKSMREMAEIINGLPVNAQEKELLKLKGLPLADCNQQTMFLFAILKSVNAGNVSAMRLWAELSEGVNSYGEADNGVTVNINIEDVSDHADSKCDDPGTI